MRVLHVIPSVSPRRGSASEIALRMVAALRLRGVNAEIATTDEDIEPTERMTGQLREHAGVPVRFFARRFCHGRMLRDFAYSRVFSTWLKRNIEHYDLVHVHGLFIHLSTSAMLQARHARIPYLTRPFGLLGRWPLQQNARRKQSYLRMIERDNLQGATVLHYASEAEKEEAADLELSPRTVVIPHGITLPAILPDPRNYLREQFRLPLDQKLVLFLGRVYDRKGLDLLVKAIAQLPQRRPALLIAGDGPQRPEIERLVRQLGLVADVHWLGHPDARQKQLYLQGSDLFALTSHYENFGIAVLDALASGTPVLVSQQVALAGQIERHGLGHVVPLEIEAIRRGIARSLATPSGPDRATRRRFVQANYAWSANAESMTRLYREIARKSR